MCVAEDLGLVDRAGVPFRRTDSLDYSPAPTGREVDNEARRRLLPKSPTDPINPGDVLTLRIPHLPTHTAIVCDRAGEIYMIHGYSAPPGQVVEHILSRAWRARIVGAFSFPGVDA